MLLHSPCFFPQRAVLDLQHQQLTDCLIIHQKFPPKIAAAGSAALLESKRDRQTLDAEAGKELLRRYPWRVMLLSHNMISNLTGLHLCTKLRKLDLSHNNIVDIPNKTFWRQLSQLEILLLNDNKIDSVLALQDLSVLSKLTILTLYGNVVEYHPAYRHMLVNTCPSLLLLDFYIVSDQELIENASDWGQFSMYQPGFECTLPSYDALSEQEHLLAVDHSLRLVRRQHEKLSPVTRIQAWWRGVLVRRTLRVYIAAATCIQRAWRRFVSAREGTLQTAMLRRQEEEARAHETKAAKKKPSVLVNKSLNDRTLYIVATSPAAANIFAQLVHKVTLQQHVEPGPIVDAGLVLLSKPDPGDDYPILRRDVPTAYTESALFDRLHAEMALEAKRPAPLPSVVWGFGMDSNALVLEHQALAASSAPISAYPPSSAGGAAQEGFQEGAARFGRPGFVLPNHPYHQQQQRNEQYPERGADVGPAQSVPVAIDKASSILARLARQERMAVVARRRSTFHRIRPGPRCTPDERHALTVVKRRMVVANCVRLRKEVLLAVVRAAAAAGGEHGRIIPLDARAGMLNAGSNGVIGMDGLPRSSSLSTSTSTSTSSSSSSSTSLTSPTGLGPARGSVRRHQVLPLSAGVDADADQWWSGNVNAAREDVGLGTGMGGGGGLTSASPKQSTRASVSHLSSSSSSSSSTSTSGSSPSLGGLSLQTSSQPFSSSVPDVNMGIHGVFGPDSLPTFVPEIAAQEPSQEHFASLYFQDGETVSDFRDRLMSRASSGNYRPRLLKFVSPTSRFHGVLVRTLHRFNLELASHDRAQTTTSGQDELSPGSPGSASIISLTSPPPAPSSIWDLQSKQILAYPHVTVSIMLAAVTIQAVWRSYRARKHIAPCVGRQILRRRANSCLVRWFKNRLLQQRFHMLAGLRLYGESIVEPSLFMRGDAYQLLKQAPNAFIGKMLFPETLVISDVAQRPVSVHRGHKSGEGGAAAAGARVGVGIGNGLARGLDGYLTSPSTQQGSPLTNNLLGKDLLQRQKLQQQQQQEQHEVALLPMLTVFTHPATTARRFPVPIWMMVHAWRMRLPPIARGPGEDDLLDEGEVDTALMREALQQRTFGAQQITEQQHLSMPAEDDDQELWERKAALRQRLQTRREEAMQIEATHGAQALTHEQRALLRPWMLSLRDRLLNLLSVGVKVELVRDISAGLPLGGGNAALPSSSSTSSSGEPQNAADTIAQHPLNKNAKIANFFVKFTFPSVEEARLRAAAICVLTWDPRYRQNILPLMTHTQVCRILSARDHIATEHNKAIRGVGSNAGGRAGGERGSITGGVGSPTSSFSIANHLLDPSSSFSSSSSSSPSALVSYPTRPAASILSAARASIALLARESGRALYHGSRAEGLGYGGPDSAVLRPWITGTQERLTLYHVCWVEREGLYNKTKIYPDELIDLGPKSSTVVPRNGNDNGAGKGAAGPNFLAASLKSAMVSGSGSHDLPPIDKLAVSTRSPSLLVGAPARLTNATSRGSAGGAGAGAGAGVGAGVGTVGTSASFLRRSQTQTRDPSLFLPAIGTTSSDPSAAAAAAAATGVAALTTCNSHTALFGNDNAPLMVLQGLPGALKPDITYKKPDPVELNQQHATAQRRVMAALVIERNIRTHEEREQLREHAQQINVAHRVKMSHIELRKGVLNAVRLRQQKVDKAELDNLRQDNIADLQAKISQIKRDRDAEREASRDLFAHTHSEKRAFVNEARAFAKESMEAQQREKERVLAALKLARRAEMHENAKHQAEKLATSHFIGQQNMIVRHLRSGMLQKEREQQEALAQRKVNNAKLRTEQNRVYALQVEEENRARQHMQTAAQRLQRDSNLSLRSEKYKNKRELLRAHREHRSQIKAIALTSSYVVAGLPAMWPPAAATAPTMSTTTSSLSTSTPYGGLEASYMARQHPQGSAGPGAGAGPGASAMSSPQLTAADLGIGSAGSYELFDDRQLEAQIDVLKDLAEQMKDRYDLIVTRRNLTGQKGVSGFASSTHR